MAVREFNIPFGPDKTGGLGLGIFAEEESEEPADPLAEPPIPQEEPNPVRAAAPAAERVDAREAAYQDEPETPSLNKRPSLADAMAAQTQAKPATFSRVFKSSSKPAAAVADQPKRDASARTAAAERADGAAGRSSRGEQPKSNLPEIVLESPTAAQTVSMSPLPTRGAAGSRTGAGSASAAQKPRAQELREQLRDEEDAAIAQGYDDVQMSFAALKNSFGQSRELKARKQELEEFREQFDADRAELADREDILANYQAIVAEQDRIVAECTQKRDQAKADAAAIAQELAAVEEELASIHEYHVQQMQPLDTELGRARASADQAKNDERSRKSELTAAEAELRRAGNTKEKNMASAKHQQVKEAYAKACDISEHCQDILNEVQRIYDDAVDKIKQTEGPLKRSIQDLQEQEDQLRDIIAELGEEISHAVKRRQYCDAVFQYPDETRKLRSTVEYDEESLKEMTSDYEELEELLEQSKDSARKAKIAIGMVVAIIVIFIIALIVIFTRG